MNDARYRSDRQQLRDLIGQAILAARKARGYSQRAAVAETRGVGSSTLSAIETGAVSVTVESLRALCDTYGVSLVELIADVERQLAETVPNH